jgi:hypothetical protein
MECNGSTMKKHARKGDGHSEKRKKGTGTARNGRGKKLDGGIDVLYFVAQ